MAKQQRKRSDILFEMAAIAERKAEEAASSDKPWAKGNLRLYQNKMSEYLRDYYLELRAESVVV